MEMLALEDIRILDLTHLPPGALCTMLLADLGAEVIKVEAPPQVSGRSAAIALTSSPKEEEKRKEAAHNAFNRNKKSMALNLRCEPGRQVFYRLARTADVIIESFRPGVVKRLKIDYNAINKLNPRIIYCSRSGYGQDGPYRDLPGHNINYISAGGALGLIGNREGSPIVPLDLIGLANISLNGGLGILAALIARNKTSKGQYVDIAYTDAVISLLTPLINNYFLSGTMPKRGETALHGAYPYYGVYETKDGKYISLGCLEPWFWESLCQALGKDEYISYHFSPEHLFQPPRDDKWREISSHLKKVFLTRTRDEWFEFLAKRNIPIGKVYDLDEVLSDPQVLHRQMVIELKDPSLGKIKQVGIPIKLSETPGKVRSLSPLLGQHTEQILLELNYSEEEIQSLHQTGVIS